MRPCEGPVHGGTCWLDPRGSLGRLAGQIVSEYCPRQSVSQGARDRGHRGRMAAEMLVTGWLYRVGTWTAQHRRRVVVVWVVAVAILIGLAQNLGGEFSEEFGIPGTESYAAQELLEERFPEQSGGSARVVFHSPDGPLTETDQAAAVAVTLDAVSYTHLRAHETDSYLVCRLLLEKKK